MDRSRVVNSPPQEIVSDMLAVTFWLHLTLTLN